jgi:hypothetical protein
VNIVLDADVQAVAEFMESNIQATKLVGVAKHLPTLAKLLGETFIRNRVQP